MGKKSRSFSPRLSSASFLASAAGSSAAASGRGAQRRLSLQSPPPQQPPPPPPPPGQPLSRANFLAQLGLRQYNVSGLEGLCLWRALKHQTGRSIYSLRQDAFDQLREYEPHWSATEDAAEWRSELHRVHTTGAYAGGPALRGAAAAVGRDVVVVCGLPNVTHVCVYPADPSRLFNLDGARPTLFVQLDANNEEHVAALLRYSRREAPLPGLEDACWWTAGGGGKPPVVLTNNLWAGTAAHFTSTEPLNGPGQQPPASQELGSAPPPPALDIQALVAALSSLTPEQRGGLPAAELAAALSRSAAHQAQQPAGEQQRPSGRPELLVDYTDEQAAGLVEEITERLETGHPAFFRGVSALVDPRAEVRSLVEAARRNRREPFGQGAAGVSGPWQYVEQRNKLMYGMEQTGKSTVLAFLVAAVYFMARATGEECFSLVLLPSILSAQGVAAKMNRLLATPAAAQPPQPAKRRARAAAAAADEFASSPETCGESSSAGDDDLDSSAGSDEEEEDDDGELIPDAEEMLDDLANVRRLPFCPGESVSWVRRGNLRKRRVSDLTH